MDSTGEPLSDPDFTPTTILLIRRHKQGDHSAFTELYRRHEAPVRRSIARRLGYRLEEITNVEDLLQETFLAAWQFLEDGRLEGFRSPGSFRSFLVKIAVQKLQDAARHAGRVKRDARRKVVLTHPDSTPDAGSPRPSELARARELEELMERALEELSERDRWILDCRDNLGMTSDELAAELGCSTANARLKHHRARERLKAVLARISPEAKPGSEEPPRAGS